jgi:hypothetical protein
MGFKNIHFKKGKDVAKDVPDKFYTILFADD